jgi:chromosome segregation ATPase
MKTKIKASKMLGEHHQMIEVDKDCNVLVSMYEFDSINREICDLEAQISRHGKKLAEENTLKCAALVRAEKAEKELEFLKPLSEFWEGGMAENQLELQKAQEELAEVKDLLNHVMDPDGAFKLFQENKQLKAELAELHVVCGELKKSLAESKKDRLDFTKLDVLMAEVRANDAERDLSRARAELAKLQAICAEMSKELELLNVVKQGHFGKRILDLARENTMMREQLAQWIATKD